MNQNEEYDSIQQIHICYINYRFLRKQKTILKINNFKDYLWYYHRVNFQYYLELCEKYKFNLIR